MCGWFRGNGTLSSKIGILQSADNMTSKLVKKIQNIDVKMCALFGCCFNMEEK